MVLKKLQVFLETMGCARKRIAVELGGLWISNSVVVETVETRT